ncbi:amidohydrolase family protein [Variovorax sp. J22R24]|uniref:amidohydrolase family protein n=1 Tax=Variovorax gracilis TaxID=3053502 RepID=UPI0025773D0F|nr:amidohydrolase family protein [Variovorax sp. J22R24]MDM0106575.1 amidohydrolase family protein [Variovorax sp. J22R24]
MDVFPAQRPQGRAQFGRAFPPSAEWLARQKAEAVLEPDLPIVDAHHHLWNVPNNRYLIEDFAADLNSGHNIVATVFVETLAMYRASGPMEMRPVGETEFVAGVAALSATGKFGPTRVAAGIVGFADLTLGANVEAVLEAHIAAGAGRFRGVRHGAGWDADPIVGNSHTNPPPGLLLDGTFRAGLSSLQRLGLSYDTVVFHPQLPDIVELAKALPGLQIVLGHVGMPLGYGPYAGKRDEVFARWKLSMTEVARCPNVFVKLGGMVTRLAAFDYVALEAPPDSEALSSLWRPYVDTCIELFGVQRCMFESNFPVDKLGTGYSALWNAFKRLTSGASAEEKASLYGETARRVYRLEV